jgi:hypothetical protein
VEKYFGASKAKSINPSIYPSGFSRRTSQEIRLGEYRRRDSPRFLASRRQSANVNQPVGPTYTVAQARKRRGKKKPEGNGHFIKEFHLIPPEEAAEQ